MAKKDHIPVGVQIALFSATRRCYAPECPRPVLQFIDDVPVVMAEMAHIRGENENSARYDESMSTPERADFKNIILLCVGHHKLVDRKPTSDNYSVELLHGWKARREGKYAADLNGLGPITEQKLQGLIIDAVANMKDELLAAIDEVKSISSESLAVLKSLINETFDRRYSASDIELLYEAAMRLGHLQDTTPLLYEAASRLGSLQDTTPLLREAAFKLGNLEDTVALLGSAARDLRDIGDVPAKLNNAAYDFPWQQMRDFNENIKNLQRMEYQPHVNHSASLDVDDIVERLGFALNHAQSSSVRSVVTSESIWPGSSADWKRVRQGICYGLILAMIFAALVAAIVSKTTGA